jgi:hypothetical protein
MSTYKAAEIYTFKTTNMFFKNNKKFWPDNRNESRKSRRVVEGGGERKQDLFFVGAIPLCCSTNWNIVQSKHSSIFNNVKSATCFGYKTPSSQRDVCYRIFGRSINILKYWAVLLSKYLKFYTATINNTGSHTVALNICPCTEMSAWWWLLVPETSSKLYIIESIVVFLWNVVLVNKKKEVYRNNGLVIGGKLKNQYGNKNLTKVLLQ